MDTIKLLVSHYPDSTSTAGRGEIDVIMGHRYGLHANGSHPYTNDIGKKSFTIVGNRTYFDGSIAGIASLEEASKAWPNFSSKYAAYIEKESKNEYPRWLPTNVFKSISGYTHSQFIRNSMEIPEFQFEAIMNRLQY